MQKIKINKENIEDYQCPMNYDIEESLDEKY
jgi:hypothetical protein